MFNILLAAVLASWLDPPPPPPMADILYFTCHSAFEEQLTQTWPVCQQFDSFRILSIKRKQYFHWTLLWRYIYIFGSLSTPMHVRRFSSAKEDISPLCYAAPLCPHIFYCPLQIVLSHQPMFLFLFCFFLQCFHLHLLVHFNEKNWKIPKR